MSRLPRKRPIESTEEKEEIEEVEEDMEDIRMPLALHEPKLISEQNEWLYDKLMEYINNVDMGSLIHVYPTEYLMTVCGEESSEKFAASSLRMRMKETPRKGARTDEMPPTPKIHFYWEYMSNSKWASSMPTIRSYIKERLKSTLCSDETSMSIQSLVVQTSSLIMNNVCRMVDQKIRNEAELRFCIGDPILCGICDTWQYKAKLEESVKDQTVPSATSKPNSPQTEPSEPSEPSGAQPGPSQPKVFGTPRGLKLQQKVITEQSRADYMVYLVRRPDGEIISVIIEAKHTSHSFLDHVIAQLIGYFAAFKITVDMPLVFVLTELYVQIVLFPFVDSDRTHLINAVVLPRLGIFEESGGINQQTLHLLLSLSKSFMHTVEVALPDGCYSISRAVVSTHIQTESQRIAQMLAEAQREAQIYKGEAQIYKEKYEAAGRYKEKYEAVLQKYGISDDIED